MDIIELKIADVKRVCIRLHLFNLRRYDCLCQSVEKKELNQVNRMNANLMHIGQAYQGL